MPAPRSFPRAHNVQIAMNVLAIVGAKIAHFYTGNLESSVETVAHIAAKRLKVDGTLDVTTLQSAIASGNPWTRIDSCRKAAGYRTLCGCLSAGNV